MVLPQNYLLLPTGSGLNNFYTLYSNSDEYKDMESDITIIIPISRDSFLKELFESLNNLICDVERTGIFMYIDGDVGLLQKVRLFLSDCKFSRKEIILRNKGIPSVSDVRRRRQRIADIHNEIKTKIPKSKFVFLIEDDTIIPRDALMQIETVYYMTNFTHKLGFISGIELGRWGFPIIGGWRQEDNKITSVSMGNKQELVTAAGFYCMLIPYNNYISHFFKRFDDILGPDVDFGIELIKKGFFNIMDFGVKCIHLTKKEQITFENTKSIQVQVTKINGKWEQEIL